MPLETGPENSSSNYGQFFIFIKAEEDHRGLSKLPANFQSLDCDIKAGKKEMLITEFEK